MRLVTYNIQYGKGKDGRYDLERIAGEVRGADLVALQEVERHWQRSGLVDQPAALSALLPQYHWVYGPGVDVDASETDAQGRILSRHRRQFGNMLLSRTPILYTRTHLLPKDAALGAALSLQRVALEGVVRTPGGRTLRFCSVHLTHLAAATRLPQVETLLGLHERACRDGAPVTGDGLLEEWVLDGTVAPMPREAVLMGDFNCEPDSAEYERIVGPLSPFAGRMSSPEGFVDAWAWLGNDPAQPPTAELRGQPMRLDYVFVSAALAERIRDARVDTQAQGSDHQPVWVELDV